MPTRWTACRWLYVSSAGGACKAHGAQRAALQSSRSRASGRSQDVSPSRHGSAGLRASSALQVCPQCRRCVSLLAHSLNPLALCGLARLTHGFIYTTTGYLHDTLSPGPCMRDADDPVHALRPARFPCTRTNAGASIKQLQYCRLTPFRHMWCTAHACDSLHIVSIVVSRLCCCLRPVTCCAGRTTRMHVISRSLVCTVTLRMAATFLLAWH